MKDQSRDIRQMAARAGLTVVDIITTDRRVKTRVRAPDGRTAVLTTAKTPSDHRAAKNNEAWLRRFARKSYPTDRSPK